MRQTEQRDLGGLVRPAAFVLLALVGIYAIANPPGRQAAPTSPGTPAGPGRASVTIEGSGTSKSRPFALFGNYEVTWRATPDSDVGCFHGADLERADGELINETLVIELLDDRAAVSGTTSLYNLDDASYYVDANSGCAWSFTFSPR